MDWKRFCGCLHLFLAGKKSFIVKPWHYTKHPSLPGLCQHFLIHSIHTLCLVYAPDVTHICIHTHTSNRSPWPSITHTRLPSFCSRGLMGNLLKVLTCAELEHGPIVFLDFERELISFLFFEFCFFVFLALLIPICVHYIFHFLFLSVPLSVHTLLAFKSFNVQCPPTVTVFVFPLISRSSMMHKFYVISQECHAYIKWYAIETYFMIFSLLSPHHWPSLTASVCVCVCVVWQGGVTEWVGEARMLICPNWGSGNFLFSVHFLTLILPN